MKSFCVAQLTSGPDLRAREGVLSDGALAVTLEAAEAAARIVQRAQQEADALRERAIAESRQAVLEAESEALRAADALLAAVRRAQEEFLLRAEEIVIDLAQQVFARLASAITPREKIEAALRLVQKEAPPNLIMPVLRVHPEDMDLLPPLEWAVKTNPALARGACRLEAGNGEWSVGYDAAVEALNMALADIRQSACGNNLLTQDPPG